MSNQHAMAINVSLFNAITPMVKPACAGRKIARNQLQGKQTVQRSVIYPVG